MRNHIGGITLIPGGSHIARNMPDKSNKLPSKTDFKADILSTPPRYLNYPNYPIPSCM